MMNSKDGGPGVDVVSESEFGGLDGVFTLPLHKKWGHVYGRQSRGSGKQRPGVLTLLLPIPEDG